MSLELLLKRIQTFLIRISMVDFFLDPYKETSIILIVLEMLAFFLGIWSVLLAKKVNILVYPTGLVATLITTYLLYVAGYLGDMILNGYFSLMSIYGWHQWSSKKERVDDVFISRTTSK